MGNILTETNRIRKLMELPLILEGTSDKVAILIDGTSSAGKSYTSEILNAVPLSKASDPNQWVIIGSDDFAGDNENKIKYDHAGDGPNQAAGEEFHKLMSTERKDDDYGGKRGETNIAYPKHPRNKDIIPDTDPRVWYMTQEFKYGPWKKVIFDDIGNDILKYVPNVKHNILLHAPIHILVKNVSDRNKKGGDEKRDPKDVLEQYLEKYEATKQTPDITKGDPTTELTYKGLVGLLSQSIDDGEFIEKFINKLGVKDDGVYYIKVKDNYLTADTQLINVDSDRKVYLDKFKDIVS